MLNELYDLSLSLEKAGIPTEEWHKDFKEIKKTKEPQIAASGSKAGTSRKAAAQGTPAFVVSINRDGDIANLEQVGQARLNGARYWQTENGVSFPCFNVRPLFKAYMGDAVTPAEQEAFDKWIRFFTKSGKFTEHDETIIRGYLLKENCLWEESQQKRIAKCLGGVPKRLLDCVGQPPDDYKAVKEIIDRSAKLAPSKLLSQLTEKIIEQMRNTPDNSEELIRFLLYIGEKKPANSILLALELDDGLSNFKNPVINRKTHAWINTRLLASETKRRATGIQSEEKDAFGLPISGWDEKYGSLRKIGIFGDVILRAMSKDSPCQYRYGLADFKSFVAGAELRKRARGALKWLAAPELKDKTWGNVTLVRGDQEILLVYPSELPDAPVAAVAMFGGSITNPESQSARFSELAKNVTDALRSIPRPLRDVEMRVFALRKMDKARTQVSCNRHYSAERLVASAQEWQGGCDNVPAILVKQWGKEKGSKPEWNCLGTPFPLEVIWCLNTVWNKATDVPSRVREFSSSDGVGLLLDEEARIKPLLERAMHAAIRNNGNLLMAMAHMHHLGEVHKIGGKYEKQKLLLPAILGLFLAKLGRKKEEYMKTAPYLIGRMLSLADQMHYLYCQHVRNKQTPTQLIGNALMATALEEPEKALALYAQRILPYQAWARTFKGSDDDQKRIKGTLKQLGETCSEVSLENVPDQCADADKAQMLLGYLARFEKSE